MKNSTRPVVLVTGGAARTGLAIAQEFAARGYDVAVQYKTAEADARAAAVGLAAGSAADSTADHAQAQVRIYRADLGEEADIAALIAGVYADFGRLDVLVNNASVFFQDRLADFTVADLDQAWRVNCRAPLLLARAFYDHAGALQHTGVVINIVDQKVKGNFHADHFSYTVAKTAIGQLTEMLAISCSPVLRVNAIFPGLMLPSGDQSQADFEYAAKLSNPLGYAATTQDCARAAAELADPRYNGTDLILDAGQNLLRVDRDVIYKFKARDESGAGA